MNRRSIRLKGYDYSLEGAYFVTIVTYKHNCLFGEIVDEIMCRNECGKIASSQWIRLGQRFHPSDFSAFTIMPNHFHGIVRICRGVGENSQESRSLVQPLHIYTGNNWAGAGVDFDTNDAHIPPLRPYTDNINAPDSLGGIIRAYKSSVTYRVNLTRGCSDPPIWQRNYYEHIIRNEKEYSNIIKYIETNPLNWRTDRLWVL